MAYSRDFLMKGAMWESRNGEMRTMNSVYVAHTEDYRSDEELRQHVITCRDCKDSSYVLAPIIIVDSETESMLSSADETPISDIAIISMIVPPALAALPPVIPMRPEDVNILPGVGIVQPALPLLNPAPIQKQVEEDAKDPNEDVVEPVAADADALASEM